MSRQRHRSPAGRSVLGEGFRCRRRVQSLAEQFDLAVLGVQYADVGLLIDLPRIGDQSFDLVFRSYLVGGLDKVQVQFLKRKSGILASRPVSRFSTSAGPRA